MNICFIKLAIVGGFGVRLSLALTVATENCYEHIFHHSGRCGGCVAACVVCELDADHGNRSIIMNICFIRLAVVGVLVSG